MQVAPSVRIDDAPRKRSFYAPWNRGENPGNGDDDESESML